MGRVVKVALELDPGKFVTGMEPAKRTGHEFENQLQRLDLVIRRLPDVHIDAEVGPAERKLAELRSELASLTDERVGVSIGGREAMAQIEKIKAELKMLAATSTNMQVKFDSNAALVELEKLTAKVTPAAKKSGQDIGKAITDGITKQTANPAQFQLLSAEVLGPAIAAASPMVAAGISAAVITGIGLGFLGIGAFALKGNKDIQAAFGGLEKDLASTFTGAATPLAQPFVDALHTIDTDVKSLGPGLKSAFAALAPAVAPLAAGLGGFVKDIMPGLEAGVRASVPLITELGHELPGLGAALGTLIKDLGDAAPSAVKFLQVSFAELDGTLRILGGTLKVLAGVYGAAFDFWKGFGVVLRTAADGLNTAADGLGRLTGGMVTSNGSMDMWGKKIGPVDTALGLLGQRTAYTADQISAFQTKVTTLTPSLSTLAGAMTDKVISSLMGIDRANIAVASSLTNMDKALVKGKDSLNIHSAAGQKNRTTILDAVAANVQLYDAQIASGISSTDAAAAYDQNTKALEANLRKAGLTKNEIDGLIGKYRNVPHNVNTLIATQGLTDAINSLSDLLRVINHIPRQKLITVTTVYQTFGAKPANATAHRAAGGPVSAGQPYIVGEFQPELFVPAVSGTIVPRVPSFASADYGSPSPSYTPGQYGSPMAGGGGSSGGGTATLNLNATFVLPSGEVVHRQLVRYALDTNRMPSQLFPASSR
jgi:X-X-X-Leu-X-X-Gly heptad repeat protein